MIKIKKNLAIWDRGIRLVIATVMIGASLFFRSWIGDDLLVNLIVTFGMLNFLASLLGWCPVYSLANISTLKEVRA
jgi:hypothetical protein